jgi:hypothetical protein
MNKFEGSKKDMAQDAKLAKKYKMSPKEYEKSAVDAKHDKQKSMAGLKHGGSMYASGGTVAKDGKGPEGMRERMRGKGPEGMRERMRGMMGGKGPEGMRERMRGMGAERPARPMGSSMRSQQGLGGQNPNLIAADSGQTPEQAQAEARRQSELPRPRFGGPPARPAVMPMARPAVMPVRPGMAKGGMAKGGMAKDGVAKKGKTSTKMVKMASGGSFRSSANGIASKGKTKGRMC